MKKKRVDKKQADKKQTTDKRKCTRKKLIVKTVLLASACLVFLVCLVFGLVWGIKGAIEKKESLPTVRISLGDADLEEIKNGSKEKKYENNTVEVWGDDMAQSFSDVVISGHGNSTWGMPKRPFQLKFNKKVNLLGMGRAKKWVLLANYYDEGEIRNDVALMLAEMLGMRNVERGRFVELYFNDEYEGLYYVVQKVEIGKNLVDLKNEKGVLVESDNLHREAESCYTSYMNNCLVLKDSVTDDSTIIEDAMEDFMKNYNALEIAAKTKDFEAVKKMIDTKSFAEYYLINEFAVNPDAYSSSFFLYKDGEGDKIHAGPIWDFDLAFANHNWAEWAVDEKFYSPRGTMARKDEAFGYNGFSEDLIVSKLFYYLMDIPEFENEVKAVFREKMSGRGEELNMKIRKALSEIKRSAEKDVEKWGMGDFQGESDYILRWVEERFEYFEDKYGGTTEDARMI